MLEVTTHNIDETARVFKCLNSETRLRILALTVDMELSQATLAKVLNLSHSTVSVHTEKLRRSGLVTIRRDEYNNKYVRTAHRKIQISILPPSSN